MERDEELKAALGARDWGSIRALLGPGGAARDRIDAPLYPFDTPALVHFAGAQDLEMVELLLELGADPNRKTDWWAGGFHALYHARGEVADRLLAAGAVPDACAAAALDRPDLLRRMLDERPERVHERGGDGQTPLHFARSREVVDLLLERGADIDARDVDHRSTPAEWMLAGRRGAGRYALAEYLVDRGSAADLFMAAALGRTDRIDELLSADPGLTRIRTSEGEYGERPPSSFHIYTWTIGEHLSPFQVASQFDQPAALERLRRYATARELFLAACLAAREDEARALLREHPGFLTDADPDLARALPNAGWGGNTAAVDLMLRLGFDPATPGPAGGTVLHCAAWQGAAECIETALRHEGARRLLERRDPTHGSTPLGWCCHGARFCRNPEGDYPAVARLLLAAGAQPGPNLADAPEEVLAVLRAT